MSDVTALLATRDCSTVGCPYEADAPDGLCRHCRRSRPRLRLVHSREETPVKVTRKPVCRNHPERPAPTRGKYAYLCVRCRAEKSSSLLSVVPEPAIPESTGGEPGRAGPLLEAMLSAAPAYELANEAAAVVKDRMASYGDPEANHSCTAELWGAYLSRREDRRITLTPADVCWLNVLQKISREAHMAQGDNRLDIMGFAINAELIARGK